MQHTPDALWLEILSELDVEARDDIFLRQAVPYSLTDEALQIAVPSSYTQVEIEERFLKELQRVLSHLIGPHCTLKITVDPEPTKESGVEQTTRRVSDQQGISETTGLNASYIFDRFVVGRSNMICHATALSVSENPGGEYNPLFIYGGVGLGKTHLLHAIGNRALSTKPERKVLYVTSETFMNDYIESIVGRGDTTSGFRTKYREIDLLLIDDIQFLQRKEGTQEEFFNTFNTLYLRSNQIVMSSDRAPYTLQNLEERLLSRLEWGMVAEIAKPQYETRLAILHQKCQDHGEDGIPDEVLTYIAEMVQTNIRELEGTLVRLIAQASILGERLDIDFARRVLNDVSKPIRGPHRTLITAETIQQIVADYFDLNVDELTSAKRTKSVVLPRQIAMYLCREMTPLSFIDIAAAFQRQNHTTIIHAHAQVEKLMEEDESTKDIIKILIESLK